MAEPAARRPRARPSGQLVLVASAGSSSSRRARPTRRSGTRGRSRSAPPTLRRRGSRSARSCCTWPSSPVDPGALGWTSTTPALDRPAATEPGVLTRRGLCGRPGWRPGWRWWRPRASPCPTAPGVGAGVRSGRGPQDVPVNKAVAARVTASATCSDYRLVVANGEPAGRAQPPDPLALPQSTHELPIACVEGWSASGTWTGVPVRDLLDQVDVAAGTDVPSPAPGVGAVHDDRPARERRRRRPHPCSPWRWTGSRCPSTTASRPAGHRS